MTIPIYATKPYDTIGLSSFKERPIDADKLHRSVVIYSRKIFVFLCHFFV